MTWKRVLQHLPRLVRDCQHTEVSFPLSALAATTLKEEPAHERTQFRIEPTSVFRHRFDETCRGRNHRVFQIGRLRGAAVFQQLTRTLNDPEDISL